MPTALGSTTWSRSTFAPASPRGTPRSTAIVSAPLVADDEVVVRTHASVYLVDRFTGAITWRQPVTFQAATYLNTGSRMGLAAGDGYLVVPTDSHIDVLRGDGRVAVRPGTGASAPATAAKPRCAPVTVRLPRRLAHATIRAHHRRLAVRRRGGRLRVTVPVAVAVRGVAHLVVSGRTRGHRRLHLQRDVHVCRRR